jgi:predicted RNA-binding protein with TRAM domain
MSQPLDDLMGNSLTEPIADMADDADVEVQVVDDRPSEDQVAPRDDSRPALDEDAQEIENLGGRAGKRIQQLKYEFHEERRNKEAAVRMQEEAIRYAQQVDAQNRDLRGVLERGEKVLLSEIHSRTDSQLAAAKENYKKAYESGDSDEIVEAQEQLNRTVIEAQQASQYTPVVEEQNRQAMQQQAYMQQMAARRAQMQQAQQAQLAQQQAQSDPKLQDWMGKNKWFGQDSEKTQFAMGVHEKLVREEGLDPRSEEYYSRIDNRMREVFPETFSDQGTGDPAVGQGMTTVVAPAKRGSAPARKVQLTSTQVALAKRLGITPEQYAKQLTKENR